MIWALRGEEVELNVKEIQYNEFGVSSIYL